MQEDDGDQDRWMDAGFRVAFGLEQRLDRLRARQRRAAGDAMVTPYLGFGSGNTLRLRCRVLRDLPVPPARPGDGPFRNLALAWKRFASAEIAHATVGARVGRSKVEHRLRADDEGFVDTIVELEEPLQAGTVPVVWRVLEPPPDDAAEVEGAATVVRTDAPFGVISDIDDTVLVSDATDAARVLARTLLRNVHDRVPFDGVSELYRQLAAAGGPFFYVSSSPWNLHGPLTRFLELQGLPLGPLLLRDWGLTSLERRGHAGHKLAAIRRVLEGTGGLRFLLIGDSGQEDPEIYTSLVRDRPERVAGVLIRDVSGSRRDRVVDELALAAERSGILYRRVADSTDAARTAREAGWIAASGPTEAGSSGG